MASELGQASSGFWYTMHISGGRNGIWGQRRPNERARSAQLSRRSSLDLHSRHPYLAQGQSFQTTLPESGASSVVWLFSRICMRLNRVKVFWPFCRFSLHCSYTIHTHSTPQGNTLPQRRSPCYQCHGERPAERAQCHSASPASC